ncbi:RING finger protein nenya [Drosophila eugracilis]|uniref:RING finger protein nenya n=1 Tax=Drosophila eugracilis TaxID=29029 RepID=UPI0007E71B00|nr:RING finger protein nenya [Drosophila eugracilis]
MFRIHCNQCFRRRSVEPEVIFHMTQCQHVICAFCLNDSSSEKKCPVCKRELQAIPINRNLPRNVANYFEDPLQFHQLYRKISKFQSNQRASDNMGFYRQMKQHENNKLRLEGFCKMEAQFNNQIQKEKKRIADLRAYIKYHEDESLKRRRLSIDNKSHTMETCKPCSSERLRLRPRTPSVTTSDNTQSDENMEGFRLDSDMECPEDQPNRSFGEDIKDFRI